jgi:hypothetical protein
MRKDCNAWIRETLYFIFDILFRGTRQIAFLNSNILLCMNVSFDNRLESRVLGSDEGSMSFDYDG